MTNRQRQILQAIIDARGLADRQALLAKFWPDKPVGRSADNNLKVQIAKIRKTANGYTICNTYGQGYYIPPEQRQAAHDAVCGV